MRPLLEMLPYTCRPEPRGREEARSGRVAIESEAVRQDERHVYLWSGEEPKKMELTKEWHAAVERLFEIEAVDEVYVRF
ncbi:hypothetical protein NQ176_g3213 [Zarea fungicola]|uniref:Uncharacterized protein n=1 Tax=Zarea fungicola TaxID=93591 RepID=A0ACC1NLP2_9HYPO|nr:hypothetical protein NQ176_g3213 [Lecanicillium fungicola]